MKRTLGRSGLEVSAVGMGCWAIGGPVWHGAVGGTVGWGEVDDQESIRAIHRAMDLGVTLFDTADVYGAGHSERVLAQALEGRRDRVVLAKKFGEMHDESKGTVLGTYNVEPEYIRSACEQSLKRLKTDRIDLYQLHDGNLPIDRVGPVVEALEGLVRDGKIRYYGWSTDQVDGPAAFAAGEHCTAMQQRVNLFDTNDRAVRACEQQGLASLNRGPLAMGLLTGKFSHDSALPKTDVRRRWDLKSGAEAKRLDQLASLREVLTSDGRSLAQGALGWIWAHSGATIPIPGFKSVRQVEENAGAMRFGPLDDAQMRQIDEILGR